MTDRPITERQEQILKALYKNGPATPAKIAYAIGMNKLPRVEGSGGGAGRGSGHRVFNPAQRIISSLTGLHNRGLIHLAPRPDGMSGTAYDITDEGSRRVRRNA